MITIENYFKVSAGLDFETIPEVMKKGDKLAKSASANNWSTYHSNENIRRVIDAYFEKLDEYLAKEGKPEKEKKQESTPVKKEMAEKKAASNTQKRSTTSYKGKRVEIRPSSKYSAWYILWDLKAGQKIPVIKFDRIDEAKKFAKENEMVLVEPKPKTNVKLVEKLDPEIQFIKRYIGLQGKVKTREDILRFLSTLQKAILEKRIRKTSRYAKEIVHIQGQLIKCYDKMGKTISITIDKNTYEKYLAIAESQKSMLSVAYIRQYISLHGKKDVKDKARTLQERITKAIEKQKIEKNDPYAYRLEKLEKSLNEYISGKTQTPSISTSELNGLMGLAGIKNKTGSKQALGGFGEVEGQPQVVNSMDLLNMQFRTIGLQGKYRELIGDPCVGFSLMVYGLPRSGKSTLCIDFAKYLAQNHGHVLYCAYEEKIGSTLQEKFQRLRAGYTNLDASSALPADISKYDFVFIDSVNLSGLTLDELRTLRKQNPDTSFIFIYQSTKAGSFRGSNEDAHDVDAIVKVEDGKATCMGRFQQGGHLEIW